MYRMGCWESAEDDAVLCADGVAKWMLMRIQFNVQIGLFMMMQFYVQMGMLRQHRWWCSSMCRWVCWDSTDDDAVLCADGYVETMLMMMHSMCRWVCWDNADDDAVLCEDAVAETILMVKQFCVKMQLLRQCWWWYSSVWRCSCWDSADVKICLLRECWWRLPVIRCGSGGRRRWRPCNWRWSWRLSSGFAWRRGWRRRLRRRKRSGRRRRRRWMMLWRSFLRVWRWSLSSVLLT